MSLHRVGPAREPLIMVTTWKARTGSGWSRKFHRESGNKYKDVVSVWLIPTDEQMVVYLWKKNTENTGKNKFSMKNMFVFPVHLYTLIYINLLIGYLKKISVWLTVEMELRYRLFILSQKLHLYNTWSNNHKPAITPQWSLCLLINVLESHPVPVYMDKKMACLFKAWTDLDIHCWDSEERKKRFLEVQL